MSTPADEKNIQDEPKEEPQTTDEIASEALDQVVGGGIEPSPWHGAVEQPDLKNPNKPKLTKEWGPS